MNPLVSVIIPSYNFGHLLGFAIESVQAQSYTNLECIIIDDGSIDDTETLVKKYSVSDPRITYFKQKNQGPAQARNEGLLRGKGKYIQFLDADDMLQPDKLKEQVNVLIQNPEVDVVYSKALFFRSDKKDPSVRLNEAEDVENYRPKITGSGKEMVRSFLKNSIIVSCSVMKNSAVKEMNLLNKNLMQSEDWDLYLRMAVAGKHFHFISDKAPNSSVMIREHANNTTLNFFRLQYYVIKMRMQFANYCNDLELLNYNRELINYNLEQLVTEVSISLKKGNRKTAINRAFKIFRLRTSFRYLIYALGSIVLPSGLFSRLTKFSINNSFTLI